MNDQSSIIKNQQEQIEIMKKLGTASGFYNYYFNQLPNFKSTSDCFNYVNKLYYQFFGEFRYSSFNTFQSTVSRKKQNR